MIHVFEVLCSDKHHLGEVYTSRKDYNLAMLKAQIKYKRDSELFVKYSGTKE